MLKAYKEIRKQVIDAKLEHVTSVSISEYNDPIQHNNWSVIEVNIGIVRKFPVGLCKYVSIDSDNFNKDMANFKTFIAKYGNKSNN